MEPATSPIKPAHPDLHSTETAWALYALATHTAVQDKLRVEILGCPSDSPSMEELSTLSYLDAVVRETLRVHPAVPGTARVVTRDEDIPVGEPYLDRWGRKRESIR